MKERGRKKRGASSVVVVVDFVFSSLANHSSDAPFSSSFSPSIVPLSAVASPAKDKR